MDDDIDVTLPLSSYSYEFKSVVSKLDPKRVLATDGTNKLLRDWRGLAYLLGIPNELSLGISEAADKTVRVLELWIQKNDGTATLGTLLGYLAQMDRYDVFDDLIELAKKGRILAPQRSLTNGNELSRINGHRDDSMILTHDDRRDGFPNYYHAYVLFAQQDWVFVHELLARMKALKFKLCTEYDIEVGYGTQYAPVAQLISERCYRIILVYSPAFIDSPANSFYSDYAQAVGIESNKRNIIPIIYRECRLPHNLMYYHKLIYNQKDEWMPYDFWEKLAQTLDKVKLPNSYGVPPALNDSELSSNNIKSHFLSTDTQFTTNTSISNMDTLQVRISELGNGGSLSNVSQASDSIQKKKKKAKGFNKMFHYITNKLSR